MKKRSAFSLMDPFIAPRARSRLFQATLQLGRRLDWANRAYSEFEAPILLLGSPRGGTTLLANIVGAHPGVYMFHERFTRGKQSYDDTFGRAADVAVFKQSFLQFIPHYIKSSNRRWGVKIITHIWKRVDYDRFLGAFPQLQIVFVVRDGRDTVLSILERSPYIQSNEEAYERWIESVEVFEYLRAQAPDRFFWYYYEELVKNPEPQVREICQFLQIPFDPRMLDHRYWPGLGSYEPAPITREKVDKWKQHPLPPVTKELTARFDQDMRNMGYMPDSEKVDGEQTSLESQQATTRAERG